MVQKDGLLCRVKPHLVGFDEPQSQLVRHLINGEHRLKVVCILGPAGLGKTTLAKEVFRKQQGQFDCGAFIYVGRNPSVDAILMDIARQVMPASLFLRDDEGQIATKLWEFLGTKRYVLPCPLNRTSLCYSN